MEVRRRLRTLPGVVIDRHSQIPAHAQLKAQIKFACTYQRIGAGDVLPSILALARQVGIGSGEVRRAYRDLVEAGILVAERRKHLVATPGSPAPVHTDPLAQESAERCESLIVWARQRGVSAVALGRLLLERAAQDEARCPSYVFVDVCELAAHQSASNVARAWDIGVEGLSMKHFMDLPINDNRRASTLLVHQSLHEDVVNMLGGRNARVFAIKMRLENGLRQRIRRLPARSRVLLVLPDETFRTTGTAVREYYEWLFDGKCRFESRAASALDVDAVLDGNHYRLVLLSPIVWSQTPSRVKRLPKVDRIVDEPDPRSLEEIRLAAGVLM